MRVDHIDGLADPAGYCRKLRAAARRARRERRRAARAYIVVEKILLRGETLPADWECDGTSGYDFMNEVSAVQHDARGGAGCWRAVGVAQRHAARISRPRSRRRGARSSHAAFRRSSKPASRRFHRLARAEGSEISRAALRRALIELLAHFPVYRDLCDAGRAARARPAVLRRRSRRAQTTCLPTDRCGDRLGCGWLAEASRPSRGDPGSRVTQFQQLSAPVAAKAVEDTAFYRYGRLLSRNDVGFDVDALRDSAAEFHAACGAAADFPHAMLATATHDHKRGEDVRARLAVLSEHADEWASLLTRWIVQCVRCASDRRRADPARGRYRDAAADDRRRVAARPRRRATRKGVPRSRERLAQWQEKALREAKLVTDWAVPNEPYEARGARTRDGAGGGRMPFRNC